MSLPPDSAEERIADLVEAKLIRKTAFLLIANFGVLLAALVSAVAAFYSHDARISSNKERNDVQDVALLRLATEDATIRTQINEELRGIGARLDEINRYLRDHNGSASRHLTRP